MSDSDSQLHIQRLTVRLEYPVRFTRGAFEPGNGAVADSIDHLREGRRHRVAAIVDAGLAAAQGGLVAAIKEYFHARGEQLELVAPPHVAPGGEAAKTNWQAVRDVMWMLGNLHLDRQSFVLAVGGGSMLDMVGFAAATVHRGLRLVRMPSTTLSQNDGGVGVKNGMDEHGQKNFIGTFAAPFAVVNDFDLLRTLSQTDWIAGVSEAFKVAIIRDASFFDFLCESAAALKARDQALMEQAVRRCAVLHLEHIASGGDPFELGSARPLDFGHWSAHKLETMSHYALAHGQAVAIGIALDSYYAFRTGLLAEAQLSRVLRGLADCGLPVWSDLLAQRRKDGGLALLEGLDEFREHLGGRLTVTLPDGIGRRREVHEISGPIIEQGVQYLRSFQP